MADLKIKITADSADARKIIAAFYGEQSNIASQAAATTIRVSERVKDAAKSEDSARLALAKTLTAEASMRRATAQAAVADARVGEIAAATAIKEAKARAELARATKAEAETRKADAQATLAQNRAQEEANKAAERAARRNTSLPSPGNGNRPVNTGVTAAQREHAFQTFSTMSAAGGAIIAAGLAHAAEEAGKFESAMVKVRNNSEITDAEFKELKTTAVALGKETGAAFDSIARGYSRAKNFGLSQADAMLALSAATYSAVGSSADLERTTELLASVMHNFSIGGEDAMKTMNMLHQSALAGNMTLEEFVAHAKPVLSLAAALGVSLQDALAGFSTLTRNGFDAAQSATQLSNILTHLILPSKSAQKEIAALSKKTGIDLVHDFSLAGLQAKGLSGIIGDLSKATRGEESAVMNLIGARKGGIGAFLLTTKGLGDMKQISGELADILAGKLNPTMSGFNLQSETLEAKTAKMNAALAELYVSTAPSLLPIIKDLADGVKRAADGFNALSPEEKDRWVKLAEAIAGIALSLGLIGKAGGVLKDLRGLFGAGAAASAAGGGAAIAGGGIFGNLIRSLGYTGTGVATGASFARGGMAFAGGSAAAGYTGVGTLLPGIAGGTILATPALGLGWGLSAVTAENDSVNQNDIDDAGRSQFGETAGRLADVKDQIAAVSAQLQRTKKSGFQNETKKLQEELASLVVEQNRLIKIYRSQREQFDADQRKHSHKPQPAKEKPKPTTAPPPNPEPTLEELAQMRRDAARAAQAEVKAQALAFEEAVKLYAKSGAEMPADKRKEVLDRIDKARKGYLAAFGKAFDREYAAQNKGADQTDDARKERNTEVRTLADSLKDRIEGATTSVNSKIEESADRYRSQLAKNAETRAQTEQQRTATQQSLLRLDLQEATELADRKKLRAQLLDLEKKRIDAEARAAVAAVDRAEEETKRKQKGFLTDAQTGGFALERDRIRQKAEGDKSVAESQSDRDDTGDEQQSASREAALNRQLMEHAADAEERYNLLLKAQEAERRASDGTLDTSQQREQDVKQFYERDAAKRGITFSTGVGALGRAAETGNTGDIFQAWNEIANGTSGGAASTSEMIEGMRRQAELFASAAELPGSKLGQGKNRDIIEERMRRLEENALTLAQSSSDPAALDLVKSIHRERERFEEATKTAADLFGERLVDSAREAGQEFADKSFRLLIDEVTAGRHGRGRGQGERENLGRIAGEEGKAFLTRTVNAETQEMGDRFARSLKSHLGHWPDELGKKIGDGIKIGGEGAGKLIGQAALTLYDAALLLGKGGKKKQRGAWIGAALGFAAGSILPGLGNLEGAQIGAAIGGSFADGGTAPGRKISLFGEEGPELGIPEADMRIFDAKTTRGILATGQLPGAGSGTDDGSSGSGKTTVNKVTLIHNGHNYDSGDTEAQMDKLTGALDNMLLR